MRVLSILPVLVALIPGPQAQPPKTPAKPPATAPAAAAKGAGRTVELTGGDDMKYNVTSINAKPGETLHVVLKNVGTIPKVAMAHNFVVLAAAANADDFSKAAMNARDTDYIPADKKADVLASTKLAGPGESMEVTFKAPAKPGTYNYLCTFPGHYAAGMKGTLVVK